MPRPVENLYKYLQSQGMNNLPDNVDEFENKLSSSPGAVSNLYGYLKNKNMDNLPATVDEFQDRMGLKKKGQEEIPSREYSGGIEVFGSEVPSTGQEVDQQPVTQEPPLIGQEAGSLSPGSITSRLLDQAAQRPSTTRIDQPIPTPSEREAIESDEAKEAAGENYEEFIDYRNFKKSVIGEQKEDAPQSRVFDQIEAHYSDRGGLSPMRKVYEFNKEISQIQQPTEDDLKKITNKYGLEYKSLDEGFDIKITDNDINRYNDIAERQSKSVIQKIKEESKDSYMKDVYEYIGGTASDLMGSIYTGLGYVGFNIVPGWEETAETYQNQADEFFDKAERYDQSITDAIASGNTKEAVGNAVMQAIGNAPQLALLAMGNVAGYTKGTLGAMGYFTGAQKYKELEDKDIPEYVKLINAFNTGMAEVIGEGVGTIPILNATRKALSRAGVDETKRQMQRLYSNEFERIAAGLANGTSPAIREYASEAATAFMQGVTDKVTVDPSLSWEQIMKNTNDAGIVGLLIGKGISAPADVANIKKYVSEKLASVPDNLTTENKIKATELLIERDNETQKMTKIDPAFSEKSGERVNEINDDLKYLQEKEQRISENKLEIDTPQPVFLNESTLETLDMIENREDVVNMRIEEASNDMYSELKRLDKLRKEGLGGDKVLDTIDYLENQIEMLENMKGKQAERGKFVYKKPDIKSKPDDGRVVDTEVEPKKQEVKDEPKEQQGEPVREEGRETRQEQDVSDKDMPEVDRPELQDRAQEQELTEQETERKDVPVREEVPEREDVAERQPLETETPGDEVVISEPGEVSVAERKTAGIQEDADVKKVNISRGGEKAGTLVYEEDGGKRRVRDVYIQGKKQRQGIGTGAYKKLGEQALREGKQLVSDDPKKMTPKSKGLWDKLVNEGVAEKVDDGYVYTGETAQEVQGEQAVVDAAVQEDVPVPELPKRLSSVVEKEGLTLDNIDEVSSKEISSMEALGESESKIQKVRNDYDKIKNYLQQKEDAPSVETREQLKKEDKPEKEMTESEMIDSATSLDDLFDMYADGKVSKSKQFDKKAEELRLDAMKSKAGDKLRDVAKKVREGKISKITGFKATTGFDVVWDASLEVVATTLETTGSLADAIQAGIDYIKSTDWYKNLSSNKKKKLENEYRKKIDSELSGEYSKAKQHSFLNKDLQDQYEQSVIKPETFSQKAAVFFKTLRDKAVRTYKFLPKTKRFAEAYNAINNFQKAVSIASNRATSSIRDIIGGMDMAEYRLFSAKVVFDDLAETIKIDSDYVLPWGLTSETLQTELDHINKFVAMNPKVLDAISKRKRFQEEIKKEYVELAKKVGIDTKGKFDRKDYFRHQVLLYGIAHGRGSRGRGMLDRPKKLDIFKKRQQGKGLPINRDYIEAEFEVFNKLLYAVEKMKLIDNVYRNYDVMPGLKEKAKAYLGDEASASEIMAYVENNIPDGYVLDTPENMNFFMADSIPAGIAKELIEGKVEELGITRDDVRKVFALGAKKKIVIPEEIYNTLSDLSRPGRGSDAVSNFSRKALTGWKVWSLIGPRRFIKYNIRNITGDAEAVFLGNPRAFKRVPRAVSELYNVYIKRKEPSPLMKEYIGRGGMELTMTVQEIGELRKLGEFSKYYDESENGIRKAVGVLKKGIKAYWRTVRLLTDFREQILRYAAFYDYVKDIESNGKVTNYGASDPDFIDGLGNKYDKAFRLSNELIGAYDQIGEIGRNLRSHWVPFWSFQETNMRRFNQLMMNSVDMSNSDNSKVGGMTKTLGVAKTLAKKAPFVALRIGKLSLKMTGFWVSTVLYNNLFWNEEEEELPEEIRTKPHIILGRNDDGTIRYLDRIGILGDYLEWFGLDGAVLSVDDFISGRRNAKEIAGDMAKSPVNKLVNGVNPFVKTPAELLTKKSFFPDVFRPRLIRNSHEQIAINLGLKDEYRALSKLPSKSYTKSLRKLFWNEIHPMESSYWQLVSDVYTYRGKRKGSSGISFSTSEKSMKIYYYKQALHYGDMEAADRYLEEYIMLGGTRRGYKQSMSFLNPLRGIRDDELEDFKKFMGKDADKKIEKAMNYYDKVLSVELPWPGEEDESTGVRFVD